MKMSLLKCFKTYNTIKFIIWKNTASDYIKKYYLSKGEFNKAKEFEIKN